MEWLKSLLPLVQAGLKMYLTGQIIKKTSAGAKAVAVQSGIIGFGAITFLIFFLASTLMVFIDLGQQFEAHDGVHFSGMMLSGLYLAFLGLLVFGVCFGVAKIISARQKAKREIEKAEETPYAPLLLFGEQFLEALIKNLNESSANKK